MTDEPKLNPAVESAPNPGVSERLSREARLELKRARRRIPLSMPRQKLQVPELPGYHLHFFLESNIPAAELAGYEFVGSQEAGEINQSTIGSAADVSGNTDMGSKVRLLAGKDENGHAEFYYLMKIEEEFFREDHRVLEERNAMILQAIFKKELILGSEQLSSDDKAQRYVKTALFQRPVRKV